MLKNIRISYNISTEERLFKWRRRREEEEEERVRSSEKVWRLRRSSGSVPTLSGQDLFKTLIQP